MNSLLVIFCFIAAAAARPSLLSTYATVGSIPNPSYSFNYAVNDPQTGDNKAQWETREGDVVRGAYSLVEPDGNIRIVEYVADPIRGFNAIVKRARPNIHPVTLPVATSVIASQVVEPQIAPIAEIAPIAQIAPIADIAPITNIAPIQPIYEPINEAPIVPISPIVPEPTLDINPWNWNLPAGKSSPLVSVIGTTYGKKGNIVRRWTAGPISLDGQSVSVKTKV